LLAELVFSMPVMMMFLFAGIEFHLIGMTRITMLNAARSGARIAASGGYQNKSAVNDAVKKTVHEALGGGRLGRFAHINITWSQDLPPDQTSGQADWVEVETDVQLGRVIPNLLGSVGFSIYRDRLVTATLMKQE
jgi:hypothetical protein